MKNLLWIFIGAAAIFLSACGKNDGSETDLSSNNTTSITPGSSLVATWYYTTDTVNYYTNSKLDSSKTYGYTRTDFIEFNNDGTGVQSRGGVSESFTYSTLNSAITLKFSGGKTAVVLGPGRAAGAPSTNEVANTYVTADIKSLNATNLVLTINTSPTTSTTTTETAYFGK